MKMNKGYSLRFVAAVVVGAVLALGGLTGCAGQNNPQIAEKVEGFPGEIPVVSGDVTPMVADAANNHWAFTVTVKDKAAQEAAIQSFVNVGYKEAGRSDYEDRTNVSLNKGTINVALALDQDEDGNFRVIYNIVDTSGTQVGLPETTDPGASTGSADSVTESSESPEPSKSPKKPESSKSPKK